MGSSLLQFDTQRRTFPQAVEVADINGDRRGDVVTPHNWPWLSVLLQRGGGTLAPPLTFGNALNGDYEPRGLDLAT